ncbi:MAG: Hsp33 family molecular chaperone HslO, partial [Xanthomonadales bacterium]|nr:Hsp33 family molecular chaperone HslO [Xanthomonadales bacterium]
MNNDYLQKFLFEDFPVKGSLARLKTSWQEICSRAEPPDFARQMLGEAVCASVLLTSSIKFRGSVSLQVQTNGPLRFLLGQCTHSHEVRGVVRESSQDSPSPVREPVLSINLEPEEGGQPYQGIVAMPRDGLVPALKNYFTQSEQLQTHFFLATDRSSCAGLMLQRMPGESPDPDAWNRVLRLAATLSEEELLQLGPQQILRRLFHQEEVRLFAPNPVRFGCRCSLERVSN